MSLLQQIADCKKAIGPISMRNGEVSYTFASVSDIIKAKNAQANGRLLAGGFCCLTGCVVEMPTKCCNSFHGDR